jgi:chromosome segregation protein
MLQALELFGFKSFADKTRFDFAPGITCVVGPNGSGKSNVVDAIKWILGDQSPKSLRGKEMTDVIFNGSANRKPAGMAEAMLTFDNGKRTLSIDADAVVVGRRIYRSGESEYLINRLPARLKDIKDLFLGTGAGSSAYSIIEQGRVDQLLQTTNANRRVVFEEAAGISRYRVRKIEAQRKLERVAQNLLRLTDIVKGAESQLAAARAQAAKAARYRELFSQLRELRIGAASDEFRALTARLQALEQERATLAEQERAALETAQACELTQQEAERRLMEHEEVLRAVEKRDAQNREARAALEATLRHQQAREHELAIEQELLSGQHRQLSSRVEQVHGERFRTREDLEQFQARLEELRRALTEQETRSAACEQVLAERRAALDAARAALLDAVRESSAAASQVASLESQWLTAQAAWREADRRCERLATERVTQEAALAAQRPLQAEAAANLAAARQALDERHAARRALLAQERELQQRLASLRENRGALAARKGLLEELERRQEGLGLGLKEILALASTSSKPPWSGVRGCVLDLLEVDLENAALVEVALADRAQWIVIEQSDELLACARQGEVRLSGRVGFMTLPEDSAAGGPGRPRLISRMERASADLSGYEGVVCRADRLVRSASGIRGLPEALLADTWVVASLDVAVGLAGSVGGRCRFVTLQGELLEATGTLYLGSPKALSQPLSRKSELRQVKNELSRVDLQRTALEQELLAQAAALARLAEEESQCKARLDALADELSRLQAQIQRSEMVCSQTAAALEEAAARRDQAVVELDQAIPAAEAARLLADHWARRQSEREAQVAELEREVAEVEANRRALAASVVAAKDEQASELERLRQLEARCHRLDHEHFQHDLQFEEVLSRLKALELKRGDLAGQTECTQARLRELALEAQGIQQELLRAQGDRDVSRQARGVAAQQELEARQTVRAFREQAFQLELVAADLRHQCGAVAQRLRDEFGVDVEQAAAEGATAVHLSAVDDATVLPAESPADQGQSASPALAAEHAARERQLREAQAERLRRKLKQLGQVNTESLKELDDLEARFARLSGQLQDLVEAKNALEEIIRRINHESRRLFLESFEQIRANFQELFRKLFGGGEGDVLLEDPNDVLECGIEVVARPPGKELRGLSLLSGGEKTLTAVALLLAMFKAKPSPYCILDEVDAALDEGNVNRYLAVLREFQQSTQFIVVTHNKRTMSGAEVLYGVTMEEAGVSKRMSVRFEDIGEDGQFKSPATAAPPIQASAA